MARSGYVFLDTARTRATVRPVQQRLGNESMRRFDACALCLQRARDPVACHKGHLFCKECALTDLGTSLLVCKGESADVDLS